MGKTDTAQSEVSVEGASESSADLDRQPDQINADLLAFVQRSSQASA